MASIDQLLEKDARC